MSDDLVKRLRDRGVCSPEHNSCRNDFICEQAADRIEELEVKLKTAEEIGCAFEEDAGQLREKLAKAVEALHWIGTRSIILEAGADSLRLHARMILAELKEGKRA